MIFSLVVAADNNNGIGLHNNLPWSLPNDLRHFKNVTWGLPVVMGRKTYESMKGELPGRKNIVISRQKELALPGAVTVQSPADIALLAKEMEVKEIMVIGGGEIFRMFFGQAQHIYLTRVHANVAADTFFPAIDPHEWELTASVANTADAKHAYDYTFETWEKK